MKLAFLICDGAADWPIESLGNLTALEKANTPNMDQLTQYGKMGLLQTVPEGMHPGSECANMSIMGYRPESDLTGRGALEALSSEVPLSPSDIAFRCNIITIEDGLIKDYSSGHITTKEAHPILAHLQETLGKQEGVDFFPGIQYRHILRLDGTKFSENIELTPPHDQLDQPYKQFLAKPKNPHDEKAVLTANLINQMIKESGIFLKDHPINKQRQQAGKRMATHIWPWSGGKKPAIKPFIEKYGLRGSVISAVDLIFGIGIAAGLTPIHVSGATGLPDTNYQGKSEAGLKALETNDFLYLHVEAPDEMGHAGDAQKKVQALEDFDAKIVAPFLHASKEQFQNELAIAVLPDHPTPCALRTHVKDPIPFVIYNPKDLQKHEGRQFTENWGKKGELGTIANGEDFLHLILDWIQK